MLVVATGAGGGGGGGARTSTGGHGALVTTAIAVTPGETLTLEVGSGGAAGSSDFGGGGGGWTAIKRGSTLLVVAGGGGGGGAASSGTNLPSSVVFAGGDAGQNGASGVPIGLFGTTDNVGSGAGGAQTSSANGGQGAGASSNQNGWGISGTAGVGGRAGESINVGAGGGSYGGNGWQGGASAGVLYSGGGGGAGYFGGGGGGAVYGSTIAGGSGGGGSSFVLGGTATTFGVASNGGANHAAGGRGTLSLSVYTPPAPAQSTLTLAPGFVVGDLAPSAPVTLSGTDLQASSNWYAEMRSNPVVFAQGVTDSSGNFSLASNLPSSVAPGEHTITLYGIASDGSQWTRVLYITVGTNLRVTYMSTSTPESLANTGAALSWPLIAFAALLVSGGAAGLLLGRRKPTER